MYIKRQTNDMPKPGSHGLTIYKIHGVQSLTRTAKRENEEGGLSDGAIAAIVIAAVLVVLVLLCVLYITKGHEISQYVEKMKKKVKIYFEKKNDPIAPLPKPLIWKCLDHISKENIQSKADIKSDEVYTFYNDNMLFHKDDQGILHNFETSGLTRPKKRLSWRSLRLRPKNGANNDETYTTIIKKIPEGEGELFPEGEGELTLPNSGLQSDIRGESLQPGQWCFAKQV